MLLNTVSQNAKLNCRWFYDGLNRRIKTTNASGTRQNYYNNQWQLLVQTIGTSNWADFVWGIRYVDELVGNNTKLGLVLTRLYVAQDANFNVTALLNTGGVVQERFVYDPYGAFSSRTASWTSSTSTSWYFLHQGGAYDVATGLYNFRWRDYHPTIGAWAERDPIGYLETGFNLYEYVRSQPINYLDPMGEQGWEEVGGVAVSIGALEAAAETLGIGVAACLVTPACLKLAAQKTAAGIGAIGSGIAKGARKTASACKTLWKEITGPDEPAPPPGDTCECHCEIPRPSPKGPLVVTTPDVDRGQCEMLPYCWCID